MEKERVNKQNGKTVNNGDRWYSLAKEKFGTKEWSDSSLNIMTGCNHDCLYCLDGDTLIWMADGLTKKIKNIVTGDEIYGVVKTDTGRKYTKATVTKKWLTKKPSYKITLENGTELICSSDHRWLTNRGKWKYVTGKMAGPERRPYLTTNNKIMGYGKLVDTGIYKETELYKKGYLSGMIKGDAHLAIHDYSGQKRNKDTQYHFRLAIMDQEGVDRTESYLKDFGIEVNRFLFPMKSRSGENVHYSAIRTNKKEHYCRIKDIIQSQTEEEFLRGFIAGIFDAEGHGSGINRTLKRISNSDNDIIKMIELGLSEYGFRYTFDVPSKKESGKIVKTIRILGGNKEFIRLFQTFQPSVKRHFDFVGSHIKTSTNTRIISIEKYSEEQSMYDITTSTGNFIANGLISHNCYAKADALRWKRIESPDDWEKPVLNQKVLNKPVGKRKGVIMFPTTHDLLPEYLTEIIYFLGKILSAGNQVLIASKPHLKVISAICEEFREYKDQVLFRFSIGSCYHDVLEFWEPGAPKFDERLHCLEHAFMRGWRTSVSCEPMLDGNIDEVIDITRSYVTDSIWLGKMNFAERRIKMNFNCGLINLVERLQTIHITQSDKAILRLYNRYKDDPLIKWKESIRKVVDKV